MTHELPCHLCNTYHAEREGCAKLDFNAAVDLLRKAKKPVFNVVVNTPALDDAIEVLSKTSNLQHVEWAAALKEIRALLGGKS